MIYVSKGRRSRTKTITTKKKLFLILKKKFLIPLRKKEIFAWKEIAV